MVVLLAALAILLGLVIGPIIVGGEQPVEHAEPIQERISSDGSTSSTEQATKQFTLGQIVGLWAAATLPMALLAWFAAPIVIERVDLPAVVIYLLVLTVGFAWQTALSFWVILRQEGNLRWATLRRSTWLNRPRHPQTGEPRLRALWRVLLRWPLLLVSLIIGILAPVWLMLARRFGGFDYYAVPFLRWPAYANITELASPEFAQQWWVLVAGMLGWFWSTILAEELLFRGVLLPRMAGMFGKRDWLANALLYAGYHLFQYWMIPFRLIEGVIVARNARRYTSNWMSILIRGAEGTLVLGLLLLGVTSRPMTSSALPDTLPYISRRPEPLVLNRGAPPAIPSYDPTNFNPYQIDLRGADLSGLDLRSAMDDLVYAAFDTRTIWPTHSLPTGFDPAQILALGKDPGLGVDALHAQGITGRGVGLAIIDQPLLTEHTEYAERLQWYEETSRSSLATYQASMHGPAVASLAVGRTVGVAPEADLYYIGNVTDLTSIVLHSHDFAQAMRRILQVNEQLPADRRIRVISISSGWVPPLAGYDDVTAAVREAEDADIMVVNVGTGTGLPSDIVLRGLGRPPTADPDAFESYEPGIWWAADFYAGNFEFDRLLVPMDSRTVASPAGPNNYAFSRVGGGSWVPPYIAGLYALAVQVDPTITPDRFWDTALHTGRVIEIEHEGRTFSLGTIVDPVALIGALSRE